MKLQGRGILSLAFILGIFLILIASVSASVINIDSLTPSDDSRTTDTTPVFGFRPDSNVSSSNLINCSLIIDSNLYGERLKLDDRQTSTITANHSLSIGMHTWYISCYEDTIIFNSSSRDIEIIETPDFCDETNNGDFDVTIDDIDSGDEFTVGKNISFTVNVENNGDDDFSVYVEARLYDLTDEDEISVVKVKKSIDEGDDVDYDLDLNVPYNVDEGHEFIVQVKAYESGNEDDNCNDDSISIELDRESTLILLEKVYFGYEEVNCNTNVDLTAKIVNAGDNDEEDVRFRVYNSELGIDASKKFDLDSADRESLLFNLFIPENATPKNYTLNIVLTYDDGDESDSYSTKISVIGANCKNTTVPVYNQTKDFVFSMSQLSSAFAENAFMTRIDLTNTNGVETQYIVIAKDYSNWATLSGISPTIMTLAPGQTGTAYVTLVPLANATGLNTFKVSVTSGTITKEQTLSVQMQTPSKPSSLWDQIVFEFNRQWWLFAINFILLIGIIVLLVALFKPRKRFPSTEIRLKTSKNGNGNGKRR